MGEKQLCRHTSGISGSRHLLTQKGNENRYFVDQKRHFLMPQIMKSEAFRRVAFLRER